MRTGFVVVLLAVAGCGGATPPPRPASPEPESPAPSASAPEVEPAASSDTRTELPDAPPPPSTLEARFDLDYWANEHQLKAEISADSCEEAGLGEKPDDVIWCSHHTQSEKGLVTYVKALYAARAKRVVKLLELPLAVGPLDLEEGANKAEDRYRVKLVIARKDAKHVVVAEAPGLDCERAAKLNADDKTVAPQLYPEYVAATQKICAVRGSYEWGGGTLRRVGK